ncbi:MAG: chorismate lyase [Dechloromonas sp.]|nr:MAG: chorismate lyase [Dechloromonas sp.]
MPGVLRSWLTEPHSLTARCLRHCRSFRVRVLAQGCRLARDEAVGRACLPMREVLLECDGVPVIFARSVLSSPRSGRLGAWFAGLGARSLGSLLFRYPGFVRDEIEYLCLDARHPLYRRVCAVAGAAPCFWARRSRHHLGAGSVLVTEVFLPAIAALA